MLENKPIWTLEKEMRSTIRDHTSSVSLDCMGTGVWDGVICGSDDGNNVISWSCWRLCERWVSVSIEEPHSKTSGAFTTSKREYWRLTGSCVVDSFVWPRRHGGGSNSIGVAFPGFLFRIFQEKLLSDLLFVFLLNLLFQVLAISTLIEIGKGVE